MRKPVCLLKDKTLEALHTDMVGKLYRPFDPQDASKTIPESLTSWIADQEIPRSPEAVRPTPAAPERASSVSLGAAKYLMSLSRPRNSQGIPLSYFDRFPTRESEEYREKRDELLAEGMLRLGDKSYLVSGKGFQLADQLWQVHVLRAIKDSQQGEFDYVETEKIAIAATLNDGNSESLELQRHLQSLVKDKLIEPVRSESQIAGARLTANGRTRLLHKVEWDFGVVP